MAIINVTPDSFSDGGVHFDRAVAIEAALRMAEDGAAIVDVGGESTRPGAEPISIEEEIERVIPVIEGIRAKSSVPISIDTRNAATARAAFAAGADILNDVSALRHDPEMLDVAAELNAPTILMHMRGTPATMDEHATYKHVTAEVAAELAAAAGKAERDGTARERIVLDPGFGFAKTASQNLRLLDELATIVAVGYPVAVGLSRKRFLGAATGRPVDDRDRATAVACALAWERGARLFRVHDVALTREALALASATTNPT